MKPSLMKVLVTGANGLLATNTILELRKAGYSVKAMLRQKKKYLLPDLSGVDIVIADLNDVNSLKRAVTDCTVVVHIAGLTDQNYPNYQPYYKTNVEGTQNLLEACADADVQKFVFISTANTMGYGSKESPGSEKNAISLPFASSYYVQSKVEAEKTLLRSGIPSVILNPTFMIGKYDGKPSSGRIVKMSYGKPFILAPPGGKNFVNAADAAAAVIAAIDKGQINRRYLLAGENLSYTEFFERVGKLSPVKPRIISIPGVFLGAMGYGGDIARKFGMRTELSSVNMNILRVNNFYTAAKAEADLGIKFRSIDHGIAEAVEWFGN